MPTGYTVEVTDGTVTELRPFIMKLARGMGALVTMRDHPMDAEIPEKFEPSDYHKVKLAEAQEEINFWNLKTDQDFTEAYEEYKKEIRESLENRLKANEKIKENHTKMIEKVLAWKGERPKALNLLLWISLILPWILILLIHGKLKNGIENFLLTNGKLIKKRNCFVKLIIMQNNMQKKLNV